MKYYMGDFGQVETTNSAMEIPYSSDKTLIATAGDRAEKSLSVAFDRAAQLAKAKEIESFIQENNLGPYLKDLNQERVKNILALFGMMFIGSKIRTPIGLAVIGCIALYIFYSSPGRQEKVIEQVSKTPQLAKA